MHLIRIPSGLPEKTGAGDVVLKVFLGDMRVGPVVADAEFIPGQSKLSARGSPPRW